MWKQFTFSPKSPDVPDAHLINLGRMQVDLTMVLCSSAFQPRKPGLSTMTRPTANAPSVNVMFFN